ncbi:hypothetical protein UCDDS831_g08295 [Diplodia seriata]|uniref:Uncharacterized protein n=1 Tax=Diplodia seriata TaxID=420778 RepID=A0A0G2GB00_9PEZI|nr:hypothetical protein UCDDS831_g08295 [Diplodia seriata]
MSSLSESFFIRLFLVFLLFLGRDKRIVFVIVYVGFFNVFYVSGITPAVALIGRDHRVVASVGFRVVLFRDVLFHDVLLRNILLRGVLVVLNVGLDLLAIPFTLSFVVAFHFAFAFAFHIRVRSGVRSIHVHRIALDPNLRTIYIRATYYSRNIPQ